MLDVTKTGTYHQMQAELRCHEAARSLPMTSSPDDAQRIRLLAIELAQSGPFLAGTDIGEFRERLEQALLAAEKRGEDRERERCAHQIVEALDPEQYSREFIDWLAAAIRSSGGGNG